MGFLDNYEDVHAKIKRIRVEYPTCRIIAHVEQLDIQAGLILVKAEIYRNYEDEKPSAIDYAFGNVATYPNNMKKWFVEDTITSAIGRVIGLLSPSLEFNSRASKQDMEKVETLPADPDPWSTKAAIEDMPTMATAVSEISTQLGGELVKEAPQCQHGHMVWKQAHEGAPKNWGGYFCTERTKATQCTPNWYVLRSTGKWEPQV